MKKFFLTPSTGSIVRFVRGYFEPFKVSISLKNTDPYFNVLPVQMPRGNFKVKLLFTSQHMNTRRKRDIDVIIGPYLVLLNESDIAAGLPVNSSMNMSGTVDVMIPTDVCTDVNFVCADVSPGDGATYSLATGDDNIACVDITTMKSCDGIEIQNITFTSNSTIILLGTRILWEVSWSIGTDVQYSLDFGDGNNFVWKWFDIMLMYIFG